MLWGVMHVMPSPTEERSASSILRGAEQTPLPPTRSAAEALFRSTDSTALGAYAPARDSSVAALDPAVTDAGSLETLQGEVLPQTEAPVATEEANFSLPAYERTEPEAADVGTVAFAREPSGSSRFGTLFLFLGALGLFGSLFWMMRLKKIQMQSPDASQAMQELGTLALTQQQSIHLVAVGPEVLLIGQGPQGLQVLSRYPREAAPMKALPAAVEPPAPKAAPAEIVPSRTRAVAGSPGDFAAQLRRRAPHLFVPPRA